MIIRTLSKALLLLTIPQWFRRWRVPPWPASTARHGAPAPSQHHERRREHQREHEAREGHGNHDGERHGEL